MIRMGHAMITSTTIAGDCPIHVEMHGDSAAPCIVLILGLGMRVAEWPRDFLSGLSQDFHLICVENRDMGMSGRCGPDTDIASNEILATGSSPQAVPYTLFDMRDDVLRVLDTLNIDRFAVVGFSMGGMIAQLVAAKAGTRVTTLAQICSSAGETDFPTSDTSWERFRRTAHPFDNEDELVDWLTEDLMWWSWPTSLPESEARAAALDMIAGGFSAGGYARQLLALSCSGDRQADLKSVKATTLVIGGGRDRCILPVSSRRAHELIVGSELVLFDDMGHTLDPRAMNHLENWLRGTLVRDFETTTTHAAGRT